MSNQITKLKGSLNKDLTVVKVEIPIDHIDFKAPKSISSRGYAGYGDNYYQFEIEVDGITLPVDGKVGMYVSPRNWRNFKDQLEGKKEGEKAGTNTELSLEDMTLFQEFLKFKQMMAAKS